MPYLFDQSILLSIRKAFLFSTVESHLIEYSGVHKRDYYYISFSSENTPVIEFNNDDTVDKLLQGDKKITEEGNNSFNEIAKIEMGFRWSGIVEKTKKIVLLGFGIKIFYNSEKALFQREGVKKLCDILRSNRLIDMNNDLEKFFYVASVKKNNAHKFFKLPLVSSFSPFVISAVKDYIRKSIFPVFPAYVRQNEIGINPAYQDISTARDKLFLHEKKIWLFRSDLILAVGNKNAYWINFDEKGLADAIESNSHHYINWEDRYGHPSLAVTYPGYDGSAFYAGLLAQRNGFLEVFTSSGRYHRSDLKFEDKRIMEAYLAYLFQQAYGRQPIIFVDSLGNDDYFECALFYHDKSLPEYCAKHRYDYLEIERVFENLFTSVSDSHAI